MPAEHAYLATCLVIGLIALASEVRRCLRRIRSQRIGAAEYAAMLEARAAASAAAAAAWRNYIPAAASDRRF